MVYHVEISGRAQRDIVAIYDYIAADAPHAAMDFRYGLQAQINFLSVFPERCGLAPEGHYRDGTIRQTFYKSYRILFIIQGETVYVVHIRHGARRPSSDLL
jgi:plasmid stabilization system protein ParE